MLFGFGCSFQVTCILLLPNTPKKYTGKLSLYLKAHLKKTKNQNPHTTDQDFTQAFDTQVSQTRGGWGILKVTVSILTYRAFLPQKQMPRAAKHLLQVVTVGGGQLHTDLWVHVAGERSATRISSAILQPGRSHWPGQIVK